jgi:hypothetical protein
MNNNSKQDDYINHDELDIIEDTLKLARGSLGSVPDYARVQAVEAAKQILEMQKKSLFREGLYYIVLADIAGNTDFNVKYGNAHADLRDQWFHTSIIEALGNIEFHNYANFVKTIGDAALLVFSSIGDIIKWSENLNLVLEKYNQEYRRKIQNGELPLYLEDEHDNEQQIADFILNVRRVVHLGEVQYVDEYDPLSLAVSQTFKAEKEFGRIDIGCTGRVANVIKPALIEYGYTLKENKPITIPGESKDEMSYYLVKVSGASTK